MEFMQQADSLMEAPVDRLAEEDIPRRLVDFRPGEQISGMFALSACDKKFRQARNGKAFFNFKLRDSTGERNAKWFGPPPGILEAMSDAQFVNIRGYVETGTQYEGEINVNACTPVEPPEDISAFLEPLPHDHAAHRARFFDIIRSVRQPEFKSLLAKIFEIEGEIWPLFAEAPAAKAMHHAYRGGLLEHTGEVALLCDRVAATLPNLNRDLLVTAALLHDIGKLEEMESGLRAGEYTPVGHLVGHVVLGTCTVANAIASIPEFPLPLKHELMHLILSHHGRLEHGAARLPICAEAIVLSLCDLMSAKIALCHDQLTAQGEGEREDFPSRVFGWDGERMYLGAMRRLLEAPGREEE